MIKLRSRSFLNITNFSLFRSLHISQISFKKFIDNVLSRKTDRRGPKYYPLQPVVELITGE